MNIVETQWWIIDLPPEWEAEQDDETIIIGDVDGVGEIAITTMEKEDGNVSEEELREFTTELEAEFGPGEACELAELTGYYFEYLDQGDAVRDWYLRVDNLLLLMTYSCLEENRGMDDSAVNEIISTIFIKDDSER